MVRPECKRRLRRDQRVDSGISKQSARGSERSGERLGPAERRVGTTSWGAPSNSPMEIDANRARARLTERVFAAAAVASAIAIIFVVAAAESQARTAGMTTSLIRWHSRCWHKSSNDGNTGANDEDRLIIGEWWLFEIGTDVAAEVYTKTRNEMHGQTER